MAKLKLKEKAFFFMYKKNVVILNINYINLFKCLSSYQIHIKHVLIHYYVTILYVNSLNKGQDLISEKCYKYLNNYQVLNSDNDH
jgi:hypothetical protein